MKRLFCCLLGLVFLLLCTVPGFAEGKPQSAISSSKNELTLVSGNSETLVISSELGDATLSWETDNQYIAKATWRNKTSDSQWVLTIQAVSTGVATIDVYETANPENRTSIIVTVIPSDSEIKIMNSVQYIADRQFFFYNDEDSFVLNFSLEDADEKRIAAPATVDIRIVNDDGQTVFEGTRYVTIQDYGTWTSSLYGERYLASVYISPDEIMPGTSASGSVYFTVSLTHCGSFAESKVSASRLPKADITELCSLEAPEVPVSLEYSSSNGTLYSSVDVTDFSYAFEEYGDGEVKLILYFTGVKTYDYKGEGQSSACRIGWKLYDGEGFVIKSGTCLTSALETGERFKNAEETIYHLEPGPYRIKLTNVN